MDVTYLDLLKEKSSRPGFRVSGFRVDRGGCDALNATSKRLIAMIPSLNILQRATQLIQEIERHESELVALFRGASRGGSRPMAKATTVAKVAKSAAGGASKRGRNMSAEGRARIAAAAKARWEKFRAAKKAGAKEKAGK